MAPDMALGLDIQRLQSRAKRRLVRWAANWAILRSGRSQRYRLWLERSRAIQPDPSGYLEILRSDVEALQLPGPTSHDLSGLYDSALRSRDECDVLSEQFLCVIGRASRVLTDRLHVAIGAHLLHLPVDLLDNSYGKNHAVVSAFPGLLSSVRMVTSSTLLPTHSDS
jgi:exopolysaccharide biosynthesis predicted pyruvyltransferase EpsI